MADMMGDDDSCDGEDTVWGAGVLSVVDQHVAHCPTKIRRLARPGAEVVTACADSGWYNSPRTPNGNLHPLAPSSPVRRQK